MFVRKKVREQAEARRLRAAGWSLREIANELSVSLTSASVWVRGVPRQAAIEAVREPSPKTRGDQEWSPPRRCGRCRRDLRESDFNRSGAGRQAWCRACFKEYFRERGQLHREQSAAAKRRRQEDARPFVASYLSTHSCTDCGEGEPGLLEFDHLGEKRGNISALKAAGASIALIRAEIAGCEVVCVNCHRRRTASRAEWRRAARPW